MTATALPLINVLGIKEWEDEEEHGTAEWECASGYHLFSPTQITSFDECERKWAFRRIERISSPQKASAALGTKTHKILELFVDTGRRPDFVSDGRAAHIADSAMHLVEGLREARVKHGKEAVSLEGEFRFQSPRTNFVYHGFRDFSVAPGIAIASLNIDGGAPVVGDYKTTKKISEYAKKNDDLHYDVQGTLYGYDAMSRYGVPRADLRWIYMQTEGARVTFVADPRLESSQAARVFDEIERTAARMATALDKGKRALELAPNPSACRAYGGCPYVPLCNDLTSSQKAKAKMSNSLIANLRARVQGAAPPVVIEEKKEAPATSTVMGCANTDVPAPTEVPKWLTEEKPVAINPPEGDLPPPPIVAAPPPEEKPKRTRKKKEDKDPTGADVALHAKLDDEGKKQLEAAVQATIDAARSAPVASNGAEKMVVSGVIGEGPATSKEGFTLYVDSIPVVGRTAKTLATYIEKAQVKIFTDGPKNREGQNVGDYRLVGYGEGTPAFVGYVLEQLDGQTDLMLDTNTPEGAVLLGPLMARASVVVRGLR